MINAKINDGFKLRIEGEGMMESMQNHCAICDWEGDKHYAHNDHQHTNCQDERREHRKTCKSLLEESTGSIDGLRSLGIRGQS
jgi:hypothetical protein